MIKLNGTPVNSSLFPSGEVNIVVGEVLVENRVNATLLNSYDVMALLLTVDAIRQKKMGCIINLTLNYVPYGRQDRVCNDGEAFSLGVFAGLINGLACDSVVIIDPHSDVTPALIKNCVTISQVDALMFTDSWEGIIAQNTNIVSPDAGAEKKIIKLAKSLKKEGWAGNVVYAQKVRDVKTGEIISCKIQEPTLSGSFIIIDDICDGGRTFIELAKVMRAKGAESVALYVTHGFFSKGTKPINEHIDFIRCFNNYKTGEIYYEN